MKTTVSIMQKIRAMPSAFFELDERIAAAVGVSSCARYHMAHWKDRLVCSDVHRLRVQGFSLPAVADTLALIHDHDTAGPIARLEARRAAP